MNRQEGAQRIKPFIGYEPLLAVCAFYSINLNIISNFDAIITVYVFRKKYLPISVGKRGH